MLLIIKTILLCIIVFLEINEVILPHEYYGIWKLGQPTVAGARSQNINGVTHFGGVVVGEKDTAQLGVMLQASPKFMLSF